MEHFVWNIDEYPNDIEEFTPNKNRAAPNLNHFISVLFFRLPRVDGFRFPLDGNLAPKPGRLIN